MDFNDALHRQQAADRLEWAKRLVNDEATIWLLLFDGIRKNPQLRQAAIDAIIEGEYGDDSQPASTT